jgi:Zn-dependent membrane protease YugP
MWGYVLAGVIAMIGQYVSSKLQSKFKHYSQIRLKNGLSGKEIAEKMLADNGITNVEVISVKGQLTDHYNPATRTVNLSEVVYGEVNASAAAVAAHEVGHAVQHATAYGWLTMRSKMVPVVNIASKGASVVLAIGVAIAASTNRMTVLIIGLCLFAMSTLFTFVTLPVEFDASNRALAWMDKHNMVTQEEYGGAKDALKWAARTYIVAAIGSLGTLLFYVFRVMGQRRGR